MYRFTTWLTSVGVLAAALPLTAEESRTVRVATYNIRFLSGRGGNDIEGQGDRLANLKKVIERLKADVIGLQEIDDRDALELVFPADAWHLIIDDDSGDRQDLALAVRKTLKIHGFDDPSKPDADDKHFLFPAGDLNQPFPKRRDVLAVQIEVPAAAGAEGPRFFVMVHHAKSRGGRGSSGGRQRTEGRRRAASRKLIQKLEEFDEDHFILLGDFNDNPDDASLNILETGDPEAPARAENEPGTFLLNLTEALLEDDHCSYGLGDRPLVPSLDTRVPGSRAFNNATRGTNARPPFHKDEILFDQLLIPLRTRAHYVPRSVAVFNDPVALTGLPFAHKASDHLPVFADFRFGTPGGEGGGGAAASVRIAALLPDPVGRDPGNEKVTFRNPGGGEVNLEGMILRDRAGNQLTLGDLRVPALGEATLTLKKGQVPLNNDGEEVVLLGKEGEEIDRVSYRRGQVRRGKFIRFE